MSGCDSVDRCGIGPDICDEARYDVVFLSTGLVESVAAAALAAVGKSVLQIEETEQYGSTTWGTFELGSATTSSPPFFAPLVDPDASTPVPVSPALIRVDLNPRLAYADGPLISLLLASGAHNHTEFVFCKTVVWSNGAFVGVAASKGDVFKDTSLTLKQKNSLMRALRELAEEGAPWGKVSSLLDDAQVADRVVHGACLADDRQSMDCLAGALLATYGRSIGKYGKTTSSSPFLYPKYGVGELCSAFSRRAAVAGAVQMLRCDARVEVAGGHGAAVGAAEVGKLFHVHVRGEDGVERRVSAAAVVGGQARPAPSREDHGTIRCVALVRGRLLGEHPDSNNYLAAFPGPRTTWMLQLDRSSGCCEQDGHTVVQLWTSSRKRRGSGAPDARPQPPMDEFREILLRHFDCSRIFGDAAREGAPREGAPRIEALWMGREGDGSSPIDHPAPGVVTDYDGRLARNGLASFVGLAEEAERLFRRVCNDNDVAFPFREHSGAGDESEERMLDELSSLLTD